jgi:lysophospholipase
MIPARDCFEPVAIAAAGTRLRAARFAADAAPRGVCLLLNGQTEFIEKYFEVIDELRGRGFAVATLDWRGQGGSGRLVPEAPLKGHIGDFAEYDADLEAAMDQLLAPMLAPGERPIALAHSMGGHILLRYLHRHPGRIKAAACCAPMLRFSTRGQPRWLVRLLTDLMTGSGHGTDFVWGMAARDPLRLSFADQIVTSDAARFQRTRDFLARHPQLRLAGPTWGWVAAAYRSIARLARPDYAEAIATPVLICGAGHDRVCITDAARRFAATLPRGTYREIAGAEHEILMERDIFRSKFWTVFDTFMAE